MNYANAAFAFQIIGALILLFLSADGILDYDDDCALGCC